MDKWIFALMSVAFVLREVANLEESPNNKSCKKRTSLSGGEELVCQNATVDLFRNFDYIIVKTHWLSCENCTLERLNDKSFNLPGRNNIAVLYLINSKIQVVQANAFKKFAANLRVLNLRNNLIESPDANSLVDLKKLLQLDLSRNCLKILTNNLFVENERLDLLNLNYNQIFHVQSNAFAGLSQLKYLHLNYNQLTKLENDVFRFLTSLVLLYLEHNNIIEIESFAFSHLTNLNLLYLNHNNVSFLTPYNFKPLSNLVDLQLRHNNLSEIQTSSFNGLKNLRFLYLGKNRISAIKPYGFIGLDTLNSLELIDNRFEIVNFEDLNDMPNLNMLWLEQNRIREFRIDFKSEPLEFLYSLGLSDNNLTTLNYKVLFNKMPKIKDVFVYNNSWKCEVLVNMFNFMQNKTVNLCASMDCRVNKTKDYIEDVCTLDQKSREINKTESGDFDTDFVTESANSSFRTNISIVALLLAISYLGL